jgi:hypothetical protein
MPDFNTAGPQRTFDLIPAGTITVLHIKVRPGCAGEGGILKRSKAGDSEALDLELSVIGGEYNKRKVWALFTVGGVTTGHAEAREISYRRIRAIIESAKGIRPDDQSETAIKARLVEFTELDGIYFIGKIGIEPANGEYAAKNILLEAITPERREWHPVDPMPEANTQPSGAAPASNVPGVTRPTWAH